MMESALLELDEWHWGRWRRGLDICVICHCVCQVLNLLLQGINLLAQHIVHGLDLDLDGGWEANECACGLCV